MMPRAIRRRRIAIIRLGALKKAPAWSQLHKGGQSRRSHDGRRWLRLPARAYRGRRRAWTDIFIERLWRRSWSSNRRYWSGPTPVLRRRASCLGDEPLGQRRMDTPVAPFSWHRRSVERRTGWRKLHVIESQESQRLRCVDREARLDVATGYQQGEGHGPNPVIIPVDDPRESSPWQEGAERTGSCRCS